MNESSREDDDSLKINGSTVKRSTAAKQEEKEGVDEIAQPVDINESEEPHEANSTSLNNKEPNKRSRKRKLVRVPWDTMYQHLLRYRHEFGHCKVAQKYVSEDGVEVGAWVMNQRTFLLQRQRGQHTTALSDARKEKLAMVGFLWGFYSRDEKGKPIQFRGSHIPEQFRNYPQHGRNSNRGSAAWQPHTNTMAATNGVAPVNPYPQGGHYGYNAYYNHNGCQ